MIPIVHVAEILFDLGDTFVTGNHPTEAQKSDARIICKFFDVPSQDAPQPEGKFGKPAKLYDEAAVRKIADFRLGLMF